MSEIDRLLRQVKDDAGAVIAGKIETDAVTKLQMSANGALTQHENLRTYLALMHRDVTTALQGLA